MKRALWLARAAGLVGLGVLLVGSLVVPLAERCWLAEVLCHLRYPLGLGGLAAAALLLAGGRRRLAFVALVVGCLHAGPTWRYSVASPAPAPCGPRLVVAHANLLFGRADPARVRAWLDALDPHVVGFTEVMDSGRSGFDWPAVLRGWEERYPYRLILEHEHFGMALLSRLPLAGARERAVPAAGGGLEGGRPKLLEARVEVGGRAVQLLLAHPHRPGAPWRNASRAAVYAEIARAPAHVPLVVFGDLNSTAYSPLFQRLLADARLADTRLGRGRQGSWRHAWIPGRWVTLDHVLVRGGVRAEERALGPEIGSDHLPVYAVLRLP
jgi:endonuclease/exonuclease/phosphatase family metal-dependent hydrolase